MSNNITEYDSSWIRPETVRTKNAQPGWPQDIDTISIAGQYGMFYTFYTASYRNMELNGFEKPFASRIQIVGGTVGWILR